VPDGGQGIDSLVREWVRRAPDRQAVRDPRTDETVSYKQLWDRAGALAGDLARAGVGRRDIVAVSLPRSVELVVALLGIVRAGAVYLPLDPQAPADRITTILAESGTRFGVGDAGHGTVAIPVPGAAVDAGPGEEPADSPASAEDPCYVMYTSGSTGTPKGVIVPHRAVTRLVTRAHYCVVAPGDRVANGSNPAFDATTFEIWGALAAGATVVVFPSVLELAIDEWVQLVRRERVGTMFLTTSLFHTVAREQPDAFASLANLVVGGEQLDLVAARRVLEAGPPRRLVNGYGPTETTTFAAYFDCTLDTLTGLDRVPVGFPLQDTALYVTDEDLTPLPPGESGELCVGGAGVALGYLGRQDLTAERFVTVPGTGERLYRTGDLARQLPSGAIELLGRRDRQVKLRGFRIELEEIELAAASTGLCDAVFVEKVGEGPTALLAGFVLPAAGSGDVVGELRTALARRLPDYMIPTRWVVLDALPTGPTGKTDRARLPELLEQPAVTAGDDLLGPAAELLRRTWQDVLSVPAVGSKDNFVELGGNSVMAVQVAARIRHGLDVAVEPADILLADTLADLAALVDPTIRTVS
jgi:amino acid adenylation domain-containing protein